MVQILFMILGAALVAFGTKCVYDPAGLVTGGVSGLSIVIKELSERHLEFQIPLWVSNVVLNVPIFLIALKMDGFKAVIRTGFVWGLMTLILIVQPPIEVLPDNLLLVSIYGGICFGVGTGLLIRARATSGGTDMLGYALRHFFRHVSMGRLIQLIDGAVVLVGAMVFGVERTLYAIISVFIMGKVTDYVLDLGKSARMAMIISDSPELIASDIMTDLDRGVTGLLGKGMYTGDDKVVIMCICSARDIVQIKDIVWEYDRRAFFVVADVAEAMGEGFIEDWTRI